MEHNFKPGDPCLKCRALGFTKQLTAFYLELDEQIIKCESDTCLYPFSVEDFAADSDEDDDTVAVKTENLQNDDNDRFIDDFLQGFVASAFAGESVETKSATVVTAANNNVTNAAIGDDFWQLPTTSTAAAKVELAPTAVESLPTAVDLPSSSSSSIDTPPTPTKCETPKLCITRFRRAVLKKDETTAVNMDKPKASVARKYTKSCSAAPAPQAEADTQLNITKKKKVKSESANVVSVADILKSLKRRKQT